jgi:hypothetical protein
MRRPRLSVRAAAILALSGLLASGCTTGLGPRAVRTERPDYNREIVHSSDAEMLLNLVRLRYNDSPLFLELGSVVSQYTYDASLSATGQVGGGVAAQGTLGTGLDYAERPSITYTPLAGEEFATRMLTPIPLDWMMLFTQTGWSAERLMLVTIQRVNDLTNALEATGPAPEREPDYQRFADFAARLDRLRAAGLIGLNWESAKGQVNPPGRYRRLWVHPGDPGSPLAEDVAAVRRELGLDPSHQEFQLTAFPYGRKPDQVGMRCRSLLGVLYFLSKSVEAPAAHVQAGLVTVTRDEHGQPFDWSRVTGKVMSIRSQKEAPAHAYVAVQHRGYWFYIADDDQSSKATFTLVNLLFSLQSAGAKGKAPILTLPAGR